MPFQIDITGLDLPLLIVRLHAAGKPVGLGVIHWRPIFRQEVVEMIAAYQRTGRPIELQDAPFPVLPKSPEDTLFECDYICGVPIKARFTATTWFRADAYDRDAGVGVAQRVVDRLRQDQTRQSER